MASNFKQLQKYEPQLAYLGYRAEKYFPEDPNTALLKVRQFDLLKRLANDGMLPSFPHP